MLTEKQIGEIREHLERAGNPVFYYDNDADGLCSFLLLRRFIGRGKGVAVRSFPDLNKQYARKAEELKADYVFILDKPVVSKEFLDEICSINIPVVWIDHHDLGLEGEGRDNVFIYNPARNAKKSFEPVTYLCYKVSGKKEDAWIAVLGCISDHYLPDFWKDFNSEFGDYGGNVKEPFEALYTTEIGKIAQALNFGLKDSTTNIVKLQNFLISLKGPGEVLEETSKNYEFRKKYREIKKKYDSLIDRAKSFVSEKLLFFEYSGELSISSEISNELCFLYPKNYIAVAYKKGGVSNVSLRGKGIKKILENILPQLEGATGGGHEDAVGARINLADLGKFKKLLEEQIK